MSGRERTNDKTTEAAEFGAASQSRLGKASLLLALMSLMMIVVCGCVIPIGVLALGDHTDVEVPFSEYLFGVIAPLGTLAGPVLSLTGLCLGIAGLLRKNCRRGFSIAGVILNSLILLLFAFVLLWWIAAIEEMVAC